MSNKAKLRLALVGAALLAACEQDPVFPAPESETQSNETAVEAVDGAWDLLTTAEDVHLQTLEALAAQPNAEAEALILEAGSLTVEASVAADAGEAGVADTFAAWADDAYVEAAVVVFGPDFVDQVVSDVELAANSVDAALADDPGAAFARGSVDDARAHIARARSALAAGDDARALREATDAADRIRDLDPERRARDFVEKALRLLGKAKELAGPDPRPEIAELLRVADTHCDAAVRALGTGNWQLAVREAAQCASIARRVIALLSGGVPSDRLEERANALVDQAEELYRQAAELAGDDPEPEVQRALDQAFEYLRLAEEALADEDWREAIRLARESIAISRRVIGYLTDGRPDGLQARAEQAVQNAKALLVRAGELAGDPPRPEIADQLARARSLIGDAETALENEDWRRAIAKAQAATAILIQVIRALT